jgi:hypothetical protein
MAVTLQQLAQRVMDLYYQNYPPNDAFLDIDDFKFHIAAIYSSKLAAEFEVMRREGRTETGFPNVQLSPQWLQEEVLTIQYSEEEHRHYANTSRPVFGFKWDGTACSLQGVHSHDPLHHKIYRKISLHERRFRHVLPEIKDRILFYLNSDKEIVFWNAQKGDKIKVQYIPSVLGEENDCKLSEDLAAEIQGALELMFKAKAGNFIQKADNQNPNIIPEQQVDKNLNKQQ